jgi:nicotinamide mononucleotide transporter
MKLFIESIAVFFSIASVALAMKKSIHNWTVGIVGIVAYMFVFLQQKLYADVALQVLFIFMSVWGYLSWKGVVKEIRPNSKMTTENVIVSIILIFIFFWWFFSTNTDNPMPAADSLATILSIYATVLMARRKPLCWQIWMAADLVYIFIFLYSDLYLSAGLYIVFFFMAKNGYDQWKK